MVLSGLRARALGATVLATFIGCFATEVAGACTQTGYHYYCGSPNIVYGHSGCTDGVRHHYFYNEAFIDATVHVAEAMTSLDGSYFYRYVESYNGYAFGFWNGTACNTTTLLHVNIYNLSDVDHHITGRGAFG